MASMVRDRDSLIRRIIGLTSLPITREARIATPVLLYAFVVYRGLVKAESGSDTVLNGFHLMVFHMTDAVRESGFIDVCHLIAHSN